MAQCWQRAPGLQSPVHASAPFVIHCPTNRFERNRRMPEVQDVQG